MVIVTFLGLFLVQTFRRVSEVASVIILVHACLRDASKWQSTGAGQEVEEMDKTEEADIPEV